VLFQLEATEIGFLQRVNGVTLRDKVRTCETSKALNIEPFFLWIKRSLLFWFGHLTRMLQERLTRWVLQATPTGKWPRGPPSTRWRDYVFDLIWSRHCVETARRLCNAY